MTTEDRRAHFLGVILVAAGAICWSAAGLVMRGLALNAWEIAFWRSAFLCLGMLPLLIVQRRAALEAWRAARWPLIASGFLLAGCFICFILALAHTTVANALFVIASGPLLAAVIGRLFFGEPVSRSTVIAIGASAAGVAIMVGHSVRMEGGLGAMFALTVALFFSINVNLVRQHRSVSLLPGVFLAGLLSALLTAPLALPSSPTPAEFGRLAFLGLIQLGLGFVLFTAGARSVPAAQALIISLLEVVLGPLWVWFAFSEKPAVTVLVGGAIVVASVIGNTLVWVSGRRGRTGFL